MRHTSGRCEISTTQIGGLPTDIFNLSLWPPGRSTSMNLGSRFQRRAVPSIVMLRTLYIFHVNNLYNSLYRHFEEFNGGG